MPQYYQQQHQPQQQQFQNHAGYQQQQYQQQNQGEYDEQEYQEDQPQEYDNYDGYSSEPEITSRERRPLILHQGGLVQFTSKDPNPGVAYPEAPHLGEEKRAMLMRPTVCQFASKIRDPNAILVDGSHLGEEDNRPIMRQGGLVQFPKDYKPPSDQVKGYQAPETVRESLPMAQVEHPDHLLPSQARQQQTYITHPVSQTIKPAYGVQSGPRNRNVPEWPPKRTCIRELPRVGFTSGNIHPEGSKHFVWPPPRPQYEKEYNSEIPAAGQGPAANAWNPESNGESFPSYRAVNIQRRRPVWPPPERSVLKKQSSLPESGSRKQLEFEEYMRHHAGLHVPPTYHAPPGTQYYEVQYEIMGN